MPMAQTYFLNKITNVLGLSVKQREVIYDDKYYIISTMINWKYDKICELCTTMYKLTTAIGGAYYGDIQINCLQAL